jgi:Ni/Co efflux regulator RcnB
MKQAWLCLLILLALVGGCGLDQHPVPHTEDGSRMDMRDAAYRADAMLDGTLDVVRPRVHWSHGETTVGMCDVTRRRAVMTAVSEYRRGSFLGVVDRYWRGSGYVIQAVNSSKEFPAIYAKSSDGFGISLSVGGRGQIFFEVDSPCVDRSAVPDPRTPANGPNYQGGPIPWPNVRDDFWSSSGSAL